MVKQAKIRWGAPCAHRHPGLRRARQVVQRPAAVVAAALLGMPVMAPPAVAAKPTSSAGTESVSAYRVYLTRVGLVGQTTANGHVITKRDHFAALPSRRGLSQKGSGDHSVRVCTATRCVYEPVWDVGPWNTKDDYWNADRESWTDLPQGKPEAQAAYQDGYNDGKDQFGRTVSNPAGIDLGDGAFWDGLQLSDNAWVTVTFLWTGSGTQGRISTAGGVLNVRSGPGADHAIVGMASPFAWVRVQCQAIGPTITGHTGTSNRWDRIGPDNYISHAYVVLDPDVTLPSC